MAEKLQAEAEVEAIVAKGWRGTEVATYLFYGYSHDLWPLATNPAQMDDQEGAARAMMLAKLHALKKNVPAWTNTPRRSMPSSVNLRC